MPRDINLTIDGTRLTVPEGTLLVEAAKTIATDVPVYCYHPKLGPAGLCRICLVEIEKLPKLQIACNTTVTEGMVVHTFGEKVEDGRRAVMEFLLLNHPLDCPICDKGGECDLQDFSMAYGQSSSRLLDAKATKPKAIDLGPTIVLDDERCIICQRCSRFDEIITNERSLVVKDRGQRDVIATASGAPYVSNFSGNVTEICPVGALTSKTYRFKSRPWDNVRTQTSCTQCAVGCRLNIDERYGNVARTMSVEDDDAISDGWLCDRGRYNIGFYSDARRITSPLLRDGTEWVQIEWDEAIELWAKHLREAGAAATGVIGGGRLLNEEIVLLARAMRGFGATHIDWRAGRQRQASPGRFAGTYADLERAEAIVAVGRPPSQTAPVLDLRIRKAVLRHGARYVTHGVHAAGSFVPSTHADTLDDVLNLVRGAARVAFVWDGIDLELGARLAAGMDALSASAVVSCYIPGEQGNALGASILGLLPRDGGLSTDGILEAAHAGNLSVLSFFGANPVLHHPRGERYVREAIAAVPFVVASELFLTETSSLAHLILPARGAFEKSGHIYDLAGDVLAVNGGHAPPAGTLSDGEMLVALAAELEIEIPAPDEIAAVAMVRPAPAAHAFGDPSFSDGAARRPDSSGELRIAVAANIFSGGGTVRFDDAIGQLRPQPSATFETATAARLGIAAGDIARVAGPPGAEIDGLLVRIRDDALPGVVSVIDGLPAAPAGGFSDGDAVTVRAVRAAEVALALGKV